MGAEFVLNEAAANQIREENVSNMNAQSETLQQTAKDNESKASALDAQASAQEQIAATAMKSETCYDSDGSSYTVMVPDEAARSAAAAAAASLRAEAAALRAAAKAAQDASSKLQDAIRETDAYFDKLIEEAQRTDLSNCQKIAEIITAMQEYNKKMQGIYDSFNDSFPLSTSAISGIQQSLKTAIMGTSIAALMAGVQTVCAIGGDPINLATGNFIYSKEDIKIPGRFPLVFNRFYNAIGGTDGILGEGWTHNYNIRLQAEDEYVHITFDDGHAEIYQNIGDGIYVGPLEHGNILRKTEDGYSLTSPTMEQYLFNCDGNLHSIIDLNGNSTEFSYDGGLLVRAHNACGNLTFTYNEEKRLTEVWDNTGRQVMLEYTDNRLTKVTQPSGAVYRYEYDRRGNLNKLINPLGINTIHNEYDENNRTVKQLFADGGIYALDYDDDSMKTTATEQNGNRIQYYRDEKYRTTKIVYSDSEECFEYNESNKRTMYSDRNSNVRRFEYDLSGNPLKMTDPLGNVTAIEYNDYNQPVRITNPDDGIVTFTYDDHGNMTGSVDPIDRTVRFVHDNRGLITEYTLPDGSNNSVCYDDRGNILSFTDTSGNQTLYEYDKLNRVTKTVNPEGYETRFEYNAKGDITRVINAEGHTREYEYNASGKLTKTTDFDGGTTVFSYNSMGKPEEITNPEGGITKFIYDKMWNITEATDPLGNTLRYEYNKLNRLVKTTDQEGNSTRYEHDPNGNVTVVVSPLGARTEIDYDALDRQRVIREADGALTRLEYDVLGNLIKVINPQNGETLCTYDKAGQLLSLTDPMGGATTYTYNALGRPETVTDAMGGKHIYHYYPGGQLESVTRPGGESERYEYDRNGNIIKVADGLGSVTALEYDCLDRIKIITNPLGHNKRFAYDASGNITSITDENNNITTYEYSPTGQLISVTDALGHSTKYGYDAASRLTRMEQYRLLDETYANLKQIELQVTTWERNRRGEVTKVHTPLGEVSQYSYDPMGNLISKTDEDGLETLYEYTLANKLSKVTYADGRTVELSYNPLRQLTELRDWLGTTSIEVDKLGRAEKVTDFEGKTVSYEWDALGRRKTTVYPDESKADYRYDVSGRLEEVLSKTGSTRYNYDAMGRIKERILPDNIITQYATDPLGRLESLTHTKNGELLDRFKYTYDPAGNITEIDKYRNGVDADSGLFKYTYDPLGRLIGADNGQNSKQYAYDSLGNRVMSLQNGTETRHSYNARNQLIRTEGNETTNEYSYDKRGNLTQVLENGNIKANYVFDAANRLVEAFTHGKGKAEYVYNGFLKRVKRLEEVTSTRYILDLTRPYNDLLAIEGEKNQNFIWGNDLLQATGTDNFSYLHDHLGSPIRLMGETEQDTLAYDEFGVPTVETGIQLNNPFGFTGYQLDDVSGLYFAQARYYEPNASRFVSEDGARDDLNWYAYCGGNPIRYIDTDGRKRIDSNFTYRSVVDGETYNFTKVELTNLDVTLYTLDGIRFNTSPGALIYGEHLWMTDPTNLMKIPKATIKEQGGGVTCNLNSVTKMDKEQGWRSFWGFGKASVSLISDATLVFGWFAKAAGAAGSTTVNIVGKGSGSINYTWSGIGTYKDLTEGELNSFNAFWNEAIGYLPIYGTYKDFEKAINEAGYEVTFCE